MRTRFQQGLDELRQKLLRMGGQAEQAVDRACQAYVERDLKRCNMVLENETLINIAEREIDEPRMVETEVVLWQLFGVRNQRAELVLG